MDHSADSRSVAMIGQDVSERRKYSRNHRLKEVSVVWHHGGRNCISNVCDLSLGGAFIESTAPPPVGTSLELLFRMSGNFANARAIVRRIVPGEGMAVEFVAVEKEDRASLALVAEWH